MNKGIDWHKERVRIPDSRYATTGESVIIKVPDGYHVARTTKGTPVAQSAFQIGCAKDGDGQNISRLITYQRA